MRSTQRSSSLFHPRNTISLTWQGLLLLTSVVSEETFNFRQFKLSRRLRVDVLLPVYLLMHLLSGKTDSHSTGSTFRAQRLTNSTQSNKYAISKLLLRERNVSISMIARLQRSSRATHTHTHTIWPCNGWSLGDIRFGLVENRFSRLGISQASVYLHSLNCSFDK